MIKKLCFVFVAVLTWSSYAQQGGTTSPYSFYGIGSLKFKGTVESRSMGGIGIVADSIHVNLRNPASFGGTNLKVFNEEGRPVTFTVGGSHNTEKISTTNTSDNANATTFDYIALSFPVGKLGIGFGVLPYTSVGYRLEATETFQDTLLLSNRFEGEGGVNKVFFNAGYQLSKNLRVGVDVNYNFGSLQNNALDLIYDDNGDLLQFQTRERNRSDLSGLNFNIGVLYEPMITEKLKLTSAFRYTPKSTLSSDNERVIETVRVNPLTGFVDTSLGNSIEVNLADDGLEKTDLTLPSQWSLGFGIGAPRKWFVGGEYTFVQTSQFNNPIFSADNTSFVDANTIAFGGYFIPDYTSFNSYWKRIVYRAGARFEESGLVINNEPINEFGISFGVGLPVGRLFSNANIGFEIGKRGTTNQNLVEENFVNFQLSLSLNDRWFVKRKYN